MARMLGVRARDWRGIWRWHPAPPPQEPRFRWLRPEGPVEFEILPAGPVEVYDMGGQRPRLERQPLAVLGLFHGRMVPHHMKPYLAALELVAMMSLATRALEGDL